MSLNMMANAALSRRSDFPPHGTVPKGYRQIAHAAAGPAAVQAGVPGGIAAPSAQTQAINTALHVIFGYIPSEILTLYVAVLAAIHKNQVSSDDWVAFYCFFVATPVVVWILYATKVKAEAKPLPLAPSKWPYWEMSAGTVAYFAWAFALPGSPFTAWSHYSSALAGIIVLVSSTILALLAPFFQHPLSH